MSAPRVRPPHLLHDRSVTAPRMPVPRRRCPSVLATSPRRHLHSPAHYTLPAPSTPCPSRPASTCAASRTRVSTPVPLCVHRAAVPSLHDSGAVLPTCIPFAYARRVPPPPRHRTVSLHPLPHRHAHTPLHLPPVCIVLPWRRATLASFALRPPYISLGPPTCTASTPPPAPAHPARLDVSARARLVDRCPPLLDADPAAAAGLVPRCHCVSSATAPTDYASRCCASPLLPPVLCASPHPSLARPEPSRPTTPLLHCRHCTFICPLLSTQ
jgi:hypothetical protein